ncbi:META domain-containing protein [Larkinella terrae]|uniref:META domain-containing protein n=1 Tax=Larkinella terrae TaxID=2025311 RepID=A0A7K0EVR4_9BACT|nr:META domain-containing protein [Larkinella terrae]MRS65842.1 META domain-containing protein [Larkinella terrae]
MKLIITLVSAVLFIAASCNRQTSSDSTIQPLSATNATGTYKLVAPASNYEVTLVLTPDSATSEGKTRIAYQVGGRSSVNQYFGAIIGTTGSDQVQVSAIGSTKMAGSPEAMQFEFTYFKQLQAVKRYELTGNQLRLFAEGETPGVLVYEKEK